MQDFDIHKDVFDNVALFHICSIAKDDSKRSRKGHLTVQSVDLSKVKPVSLVK